MSKFKVGEIALTIDDGFVSAECRRYVAQEVEIVGPLGSETTVDGTPAYTIRFSDGELGFATESVLRKKPDPAVDRFLAQCHEKSKPVSFHSLMSDLKGPLTEEKAREAFEQNMWSVKP